MTTASFALVLLGLLPAQDSWEARVARHIEAGDTDAAVAVLDARLAEAPSDVDAWRSRAQLLARMVDVEGRSWLILHDVRDAWDEVLARVPFDAQALRSSAEVRFRLGEYDAACAAALRALATEELLGDEGASSELLVLAVRARIGAFQVREHEGLDGYASELSDVLRAADRAFDRPSADAESLAVVRAGLLEYVGLADRAGEALLAELRRAPGDERLHKAFIDLHVRAGTEHDLGGVYTELAKSTTRGLVRRADPTAVWYVGYVQRLAGDTALREHRFEDALGAYDRCQQWMSMAAEYEPDYEESARQVRVQALTSMAWCLLESGELSAAHEVFLTILDDHADLRDAPDGLGRTIMTGLSLVGERWAALDNYERSSDLAREVVAVVPDSGRWWNNLGFLLRERASQVERADVEAGRRVFEESWQAYKRAAELLPDDPRVVNDAALIQVYHLRTELDVAVEMLRNAIETGKRRLAELGPDPPESERFPLAQAVGDAYQNLGYLDYHVTGDMAAAREHFVKSIATDSGDRSGMQAYVDAIDGKRDPIPKNPVGAGPPDPREPAPPARVEWEAVLAEAAELARADDVPVLIYNRGEGLGLSIPLLDRFVTSEGFARLTRALPRVACDRARTTFVDRARDGRRVHHPRYGTVTSQEVADACDEFADLWRETHEGEEPGESAEGLFLWRPGTGRLEPFRRVEQLEGFPDRSAYQARLDELAETLAEREDARAASELLASASRYGRARVEELLLSPARPDASRRLLVAGLADRADDHARELLTAAARQREDSALAALTLSYWAVSFPTVPALHALQWNPSSAVRRAAIGALGRAEDPEPSARRLLARALVLEPEMVLQDGEPAAWLRDGAEACLPRLVGGLLRAELEREVEAAPGGR